MGPGRNGRGFETPNLERETPGILQRVSEEGGYAFVRMMAAAGGGACGDPRAAEAAREMAWEQLHCGPWHSVLPIWRDAYSMACLYVAKHHFAAGEFSETLRALDMGLIMGGLLLKPDLEAAVERVMAAAKERENGGGSGGGDKVVGNSSCRLFNPSLFSEAEVLRLLPEKSLSSKKVERRSGLSLEGFLREYYQSGSPVIIGDAMSHWPATTRWNNMDYLKRVAGDRTVPVEVGKNYLSPEWKQELITFTQFLERIQPSSSSAAPTYLAQHPLFDQIKELRKDILIPDYCYTGGGELRSVNAWFGPAGTVTPLHHDPHHNILAQVVGKKYIRLYAASISEELYPHSETMLCNSSQLAQLVKNPGVVTRDLDSNPAISAVAPPFTCRRKMKRLVDLDNIDDIAFPKVKDLEFLDCILDEGEMLYIPPKWWHYIRSLTTSLSVSFWWSNPEGSP